MDSLLPELLFHILEHVSIGDSVNLVSTCRYLRDIGATFVKALVFVIYERLRSLTFMQKYQDGTEEARDVLDGRLSVVGAIARALFKLGNNYKAHSLLYDNFTTPKEISNAIIFNKTGIECFL